MSALDEIVDILRELAERVAATERRIDGLIVRGTVASEDGHRVRVELGQDSAGATVMSPAVAQLGEAGREGGGVSSFGRLGVGTPVFLVSPGGEVGPHSRVIASGPVGERPSAGAAESDGRIWRVGAATLSLKGDLLTLAVGGVSLAVSAAGVSVTGGSVSHDGTDIGRTHRHGQVATGGGTSGLPQ